MKKLITTTIIIALAAVGMAAQYSKLSIITAAKAVGRWDAVKAWIASAGFEDEWNAAAYLSDEYPQYPAITNAIVQAGVLTTEELGRIIYASRDAAVPDTMLARVVSNDCLTAQGRVKWHGAVVTNVIDTVALTKTQIHADGYRFVQPFRPVAPESLDRQLSAAGRKAERERRQRERIEARIEELRTNMPALAEKLAREKDYPLELAEMLLQNELNKLIKADTVNAVITPQK